MHPRARQLALPASIVTAILVAIAITGAPPARAATALTTVRVATGLTNPVWVTSPPGDARLFVVENREADSHGYIKIVKNGAVLPTPFFVTPTTMPTYTEQGLLGLAFPPDYATSGRFYIYYTALDNSCILERRHVSLANPDVADTTREQLLKVFHWNLNHDGGWLAFGPDGDLYLSIGDGGGSGDPGNRAQNPDSLLGKLLRLDVSTPTGYAIPADNPFAGAVPGRDEIYAFGLRNPWRNSFDRATGDLVIGDVGQNLHEEVDFCPAAQGRGRGVNFGWPCWEAFFPYDLTRPTPCVACVDTTGCMQSPAYTYDHGSGRCSITGGYVYRGGRIPDLVGTYFFADYCAARIWSGQFAGGVLTNVQDRTAELTPAGGSIGSISSFGEDKDGELYVCDYAGGQVLKIVPAAGAGVGGIPGGGARLLGLAGAMPFRSTLSLALTPDVAGVVHVSVEDVAGHHVRALLDGVAPAGRQILTWDGTDDNGASVRPGVYLVRATTARSEDSLRAVRVR